MLSSKFIIIALGSAVVLTLVIGKFITFPTSDEGLKFPTSKQTITKDKPKLLALADKNKRLKQVTLPSSKRERSASSSNVNESYVEKESYVRNVLLPPIETSNNEPRDQENKPTEISISQQTTNSLSTNEPVIITSPLITGGTTSSEQSSSASSISEATEPTTIGSGAEEGASPIVDTPFEHNPEIETTGETESPETFVAPEPVGDLAERELRQESREDLLEEIIQTRNPVSPPKVDDKQEGQVPPLGKLERTTI